MRAVEEAIANCIFHRDYQRHDPVRVFLYPDCLIFLNGGGPDRAIRAEDFATGQVRPRHYRNRRLGSFLKALQLTEGYATGIRLILNEMAANGSERPVFTTNEERTFFEVEFKRHPAFTDRDIMAPTGSGKAAAGEDAATKRWLASLKPNSLQILRTMPATPQRRADVLALADLGNESRNASRYLEPLLQAELLALTVPDRPRSPQQQYVLTRMGREMQDYLVDGQSNEELND